MNSGWVRLHRTISRRAKFHGDRPTYLWGDRSMSGHHTKRTDGAPSQIIPSAAPKVASDVTLADTYVVLCDWHGCVVWKSTTGDRPHIGDEVWKNATKKSKDVVRTAVASVVTLREHRKLEARKRSARTFSAADVAPQRSGNPPFVSWRRGYQASLPYSPNGRRRVCGVWLRASRRATFPKTLILA